MSNSQIFLFVNLIGGITVISSYIFSIALSPDHQGRGLGRRFIAETTRVALASGTTTRIIALIRSDNTRSINAFVAAGYVLAGQEDAEGIELLRYEATK